MFKLYKAVMLRTWWVNKRLADKLNRLNPNAEARLQYEHLCAKAYNALQSSSSLREYINKVNS